MKMTMSRRRKSEVWGVSMLSIQTDNLRELAYKIKEGQFVSAVELKDALQGAAETIEDLVLRRERKGMKVHDLKILPEYFEAVKSGAKTFEIRINDRNYHEGDTLILKEWYHGKYTGRELRKYVNYIYYSDGAFGIPEGVVVMNLREE